MQHRLYGFKTLDVIDEKINEFLSPLRDRTRSTFSYVLRTWREGGGSIADVGKAIALQTPWEGSHVTVLWAYGEGGQGRAPRFEAPLAALTRSGIPADLIEAWRDDLTTISGVGAAVENANAAFTVSDAFGDLDARKLVESALNLTRRI